MDFYSRHVVVIGAISRRSWVQILASVIFLICSVAFFLSLLPWRSVGRSNFQFPIFKFPLPSLRVDFYSRHVVVIGAISRRSWVQILASVIFFICSVAFFLSLLPWRSVGRSNFQFPIFKFPLPSLCVDFYSRHVVVIGAISRRSWVQILASVIFFICSVAFFLSLLPWRSVGRSNFDWG